MNNKKKEVLEKMANKARSRGIATLNKQDASKDFKDLLEMNKKIEDIGNEESIEDLEKKAEKRLKKERILRGIYK